MANNFRTLAGGLTVAGLMGLPLHLFAHRYVEAHLCQLHVDTIKLSPRWQHDVAGRQPSCVLEVRL